MKTLIKPNLFFTVSLIFISCSGDSETLDQKIEDTADSIIEIPGFPRSIKKYQNDSLHYWANYFYRSDGNLIKVQYGYPKSEISEIFTNTYYYNSEGKLIKLDGHDVYNFYWENERIVEADKINNMWQGNSKIFYDYNPIGQLIQKTEYILHYSFSEKIFYTYFENGNLKAIEQYWDTSEIRDYDLHFITQFDGYNKGVNLFLELEIIPGQIVQHQFPSSMNYKDLTVPVNDRNETYEYKYDSEGRVIEKIFGRSRVVYQYY